MEAPSSLLWSSPMIECSSSIPVRELLVRSPMHKFVLWKCREKVVIMLRISLEVMQEADWFAEVPLTTTAEQDIARAGYPNATPLLYTPRTPYPLPLAAATTLDVSSPVRFALPADVWRNIFSYFQDHHFLLRLRTVCQLFKASVATAPLSLRFNAYATSPSTFFDRYATVFKGMVKRWPRFSLSSWKDKAYTFNLHNIDVIDCRNLRPSRGFVAHVLQCRSHIQGLVLSGEHPHISAQLAGLPRLKRLTMQLCVPSLSPEMLTGIY